jgi:predicted dienelactone hydrolase
MTPLCSAATAALTIALVAAMPAQAPIHDPAPLAGMVTRDYVDPLRKNWQQTAPRPLRTAIWYPIDEATERETIFGGPAADQIFVPVVVAPGAQVSTRAPKYPLIVMSHGTGGSAVMMMWLGRHLASHGYIVAAVNHHGNTAAEQEPAPQGFLLYWERATDLKRVIDALLADAMLRDRIDRSRIGAAGFSLGGYTVIAAAGARFSQATFDRFCASPQRDFTCEPQPEFPEAPSRFTVLAEEDPVVRASLQRSHESFLDPRIKAVFAIAPALGSGFKPEGLREVKVPVEIVVGDGDTVTPPPTNAQRYAQLIPRARIRILPGRVGHYTFLHECTPRGRQNVPICQDAPGVDRAATHRVVQDLALDFFDRTLLVRRGRY